VETSKSAKRVARVAKQSAKTKVRTQRGLLFPISMAAVILLGAFLVVYAREGTDVAAAVPPRLNDDHWHVAYGVNVCNEWKAAIQTQNELVNGVSLGIHTHGDGIIHIHPFASNAAGRNAKLGVFFKATSVKASTGKIEFPEEIGTYENTTDTCDGKAATWKLAYWADAAQTGAPTIFVTDFANVRFTQDRGAMTLAFVPDDVDVATLKPPSIPTLDQLTDVGPTTTVAGATTTVTGEATTTVAGEATTTAASSAATTAAATTAAAATTTATTAAVTTTTSG
jgi:hypothetical protein